MRWCLLFWYLQDVLQVLGKGFFFAPELFLGVVLLLLVTEKYDHPGLIWISFLGGVLWDARWTGLLGMSAGMYAVLTTFFGFLWGSIPDTGRNRFIFFAFLGAAHLALGLARCFLGLSSGEPAWNYFFLQQVLGLPLMYLLSRWAFARGGLYGAS